MLFFCLAFVTILVGAYPQNFQGDLFTNEPIGDVSSVFGSDDTASSLNPNIFHDSSLISSTPSSIDESHDIFSSAMDGADDGDVLSFGTGDDEVEPPSESLGSSLVGVSGKEGSSIGNEPLSLESYDPEEISSLDIFDSSIATANCNSGADASTGMFGSSDSTSLYDLDGESVLIASPEIPDDLPKPGAPKPGAPRRPAWRYTAEPIYELDPRSNKQTTAISAFAADGTPIKPKPCPNGTNRSCCKDNTFAECWTSSHLLQLCRFAKNLFCCDDVPGSGVPGVGCTPVQWILQRGRLPRDKQDPPPNQPNPLQGVFDLFEFPDLNPSPNPNYCPSPSRH
jgi:hypothetical protein